MRIGPDAERRQQYLEVEKPPYEVVGPLERFNERDNVQARKEYEPGTEEWKRFCALHPEWEEGDLMVRQQPGLGMAVCPWTKKLSPSHEIGRRIAVRGKYGARSLLAIEKTINGGFRPQGPPSWCEKPDRGWLEGIRWNSNKRGGRARMPERAGR